MMDRRGFFAGVAGALAGVAMPKIAPAQLPLTRGGLGFGRSGGATGVTHLFMGPTGLADPQFLGNVHRSFEHRGQSLMSGETLAWLRRHHGIVHTPYAQRDNYRVPEEYYYGPHGRFDREKAYAAHRADNIEAGRSPDHGVTRWNAPQGWDNKIFTPAALYGGKPPR